MSRHPTGQTSDAAGHLLVRAEVSRPVGTGHAVRTLALGQAWRRAGGEVTYLLHPDGAFFQGWLTSAGAAARETAAPTGSDEDALATAEVANAMGAPWVVLDGYAFGSDYQRLLRDSCEAKVLAIDDYGHSGHIWADILLNHGADASESMYPDREPHSMLLLGPRYALVREEFPARARTDSEDGRRESPAGTREARRVLVTMGGVDPDNVTERVMRALDAVRTPGLEVTVVLGAGNRDRDRLEALAAESGVRFTIEQAVWGMWDLMRDADLAVSAGGSTTLELACAGLPSIIVVLAPNQEGLAAAMDEAGAALNLGPHADMVESDLAARIEYLLGSETRRTAMSAAGRRLVDGRGGSRVVLRMLHGRLELRPAVAGDEDLLLDWVNDPRVRAASFHQEAVRADEHARWFRDRLADERTTILVGVDEMGTPVGQVRFEVDRRGLAETDISVDPARRGRGLGSSLLELAIARMGADPGVKGFVAHIRPENSPSLAAFRNAGFVDAGAVTKEGVSAVRLTRRADGVDPGPGEPAQSRRTDQGTAPR